MSLSSHVLDAVTGGPAAGVPLSLWHRQGGEWTSVAAGHTDADGRVRDWPLLVGDHRLVFDTGTWWHARGQATFHPEVVVTFTVADPDAHHHVPLLSSPFSYTTYRGS